MSRAIRWLTTRWLAAGVALTVVVVLLVLAAGAWREGWPAFGAHRISVAPGCCGMDGSSGLPRRSPIRSGAASR